MKQPNQPGFAAIEALLIVVILGIVGGTGYFVWHTKQNTDKSLSDTANSQPALQKKAAASKSTTSPSTPTTKYLDIKEWGVKFPYLSSDTLSYKFTDSDDSAAAIISANLADNYPGCSSWGAGNIVRGTQTDAYSDSETFGQADQQNPSSFGKLGNYYYYFGHDQAACATNVTAAATAAQGAASDLVKSIVLKVQAE